jgi:hypothetical protein
MTEPIVEVPPRPDESELVGEGLPGNEAAAEHATTLRIWWLMSNYLQQVATDWSGWDTLYRDPDDGRLWELIYPLGHMHGGGPPHLKVISPEQVREKYGDRYLKIMGNYQPDFYLSSDDVYEDSDFAKPRKCWSIKRLRGEIRDDYLLIQIFPPIIGQPFGLGAKDIDLVIVASRHQGVSLFPIASYPVWVHGARPLVDDIESRDMIHGAESEVMFWGELYETEENARTNKW